MNSINLRYLIYGIIVTLSLSSLITSAGTEDGVFGDYFTNIITNGCADKSVVTGFDTSPATYGKTKCSTIQSLLGSLFVSSAPGQPGQAVTGFNPDGTLKYGDVNYWNKSGTSIVYTGGNVGIGTNIPGSKLTVTGGAIGGQYAITPGYTNWEQFNMGDGGAAIYNDNGGYKKLMIVGNSSAGGSREVGIWDNLTVSGNQYIGGQLNVDDIYVRSIGKFASQINPSPPVNCSYTTIDGPCSATCGGGTQISYYHIMSPSQNGGTCSVSEGGIATVQSCNTASCGPPVYSCGVGGTTRAIPSSQWGKRVCSGGLEQCRVSGWETIQSQTCYEVW